MKGNGKEVKERVEQYKDIKNGQKKFKCKKVLILHA